MTYPITPLPQIHDHPKSNPRLDGIGSGHLQAWAASLTNAIVSQVLSAVTGGLISPVAASTTLTKLGTWAHNLFDPIINGLHGLFHGGDSGFADGTVQAMAAQAVSAISQNTQAIAGLSAIQTNVSNSGNSAVIDFSKYSSGSGLGSQFTLYYGGSGTGTIGISGGRAVWNEVTDASRGVIAVFTPAQFTSNYQKLGVAFSSAPSKKIFLGKGYNYIYGRMNSTGTSYIYLELGPDSCKVGCVVSGTLTQFGSIPSFEFHAGSAYWLVCGNSGSARNFEVYENNTLLGTFTDSGAVSMMGPTYNYAGVGDYATANAITSANPGAMVGLVWADNAPATTLGSGLRVARTSTSSANLNSGTNTMPSNWYNVVSYQTQDITWDSSTCKATVGVTGWYQVCFAQHGNDTIGVGAGGQVRAVLYKNGSPSQFAQPFPHNVNVGFNGFGGTFIAYLQAGDYVQPGYASDFYKSSCLLAETAGQQTWFSLSLLNISVNG